MTIAENHYLSGKPTYSSMLKVRTCLKEISPAFTAFTISAYMPIGEEPVGKPNTNGSSELENPEKKGTLFWYPLLEFDNVY